jgi:hypothetical protein
MAFSAFELGWTVLSRPVLARRVATRAMATSVAVQTNQHEPGSSTGMAPFPVVAPV